MMLGMWRFAHLSHPQAVFINPQQYIKPDCSIRAASFLFYRLLEFVFPCSCLVSVVPAGAPPVFLDPHVLYLDASMTTEY